MTRCTSASGTPLALAWVETSASYCACCARQGCVADAVAAAARTTRRRADFIKLTPKITSRRGDAHLCAAGRAFAGRFGAQIAPFCGDAGKVWVPVFLPGIILCRASVVWISAFSSRDLQQMTMIAIKTDEMRHFS